MLPSYVLALREGLEAALIIGIVLGALQKIHRPDYNRFVWFGAGLAIAISLVTALILYSVGASFQGTAEEVFEGLMMLLAAGVLTWMIFWMQRQGRQIQTELEFDVRQATASGSAWALFSLAFVAVVREGIETAFFLTAAAFSATPAQTVVGGALGLSVAIVLGWLMFAAGRRLDVRAFFRVTSVLLILFAAGLVAHGVHELQEAALLPTLVEHVWDVNHILDEGGVLGTFLEALFGYNGNPSLLEVFSYLGYLFTVFLVTRLSGPRRAVSAVSG
jgi:high-affinity iron transporter